jgi:chorismate mutase
MDTLDNLKKEIEKVEKEISNRKVSDEVYELIALLNKRVILGKKIHQYKWNSLDLKTKEKRRDMDLNVTKAYAEKYPEDTLNKFNYKKEYIEFLMEAKKLSLQELSVSSFCGMLVEILNSNEYINISGHICIELIMKYINLNSNTETQNLNDIYRRITKIPYELS